MKTVFSMLYQFDFNANKREFIIHSHNHEIHHEEKDYVNKLIQSQTNCRHLGNTVGSKQSEKRVIAATLNLILKRMFCCLLLEIVNSQVKL